MTERRPGGEAPGPRRLAWDEPAPADLFDHLTPQETVAMTAPYFQDPAIPTPEARTLEDLVIRGISSTAVAARRERAHLEALRDRGLITLDVDGFPTVVDEVAALVALGRACGAHERPLPCLECA